MRSYNTEPVIWGGDPLCEHDFVPDGVYNDNLRFRATENTSVGNNKNPEIFRYLHRGSTKSKVQNKGSVTEGKTGSKICLKCYAVKCELGQEPSVSLYIANLMTIFNEVYRVLRNDGTLFLNIADKYGGSGNGSWNAPIEIRGKQYRKTKQNVEQEYLAGPLPHNQNAKSLLLIPERFVIAMSDAGWIVRNDIIWHKKNSMPESCKDRFSRSHEHIFFFTKKKHYYFEQQFEPLAESTPARLERVVSGNNKWVNGADGQTKHTLSQPRPNISKYEKGDHRLNEDTIFGKNRGKQGTTLGRNKRDVFVQATKPTKLKHFAAYPIELISPLIQAGCPEFICKNCGKPRTKIFNHEKINTRPGLNTNNGKSGSNSDPNQSLHTSELSKHRQQIITNQCGWNECGCNNPDYQPGTVLDPFGGISTTAIATKRLNRSYITIDINPDYCVWAEDRIANDYPKNTKPKKSKPNPPNDNQLSLF